jgi:hypothetical protein
VVSRVHVNSRRAHPRQRREIDIRQASSAWHKAITRINCRQDMDHDTARRETRGHDLIAYAIVGEFGILGGFRPSAAACPFDRVHRSDTSPTMCVERITKVFSPSSASRLRKRLRSSGSRCADFTNGFSGRSGCGDGADQTQDNSRTPLRYRFGVRGNFTKAATS